MQPQPLSKLIKEREFDRYQGGLESRFAAWRVKYQLTYCEPTENSAMYIDFEYASQTGRMTVWESGDCDLEVVENERGETVLRKHYDLKDQDEFHDLLARFFLYFRDQKVLP